MSTSNIKVKNEAIKVCLRTRPLLIHEDTEFWIADDRQNAFYTMNSISNINDSNRESSYSKDKDTKRLMLDSIYTPQIFSFDKIYTTTANSQIIYKEICRNITKSAISGYNGSIFMYGQTTSGKTYTMLGSPENPGLLPCTIRDVINYTNKEQDKTYGIYCSYIEIYNENIHDLLNNSSNLKLIDDNKWGVVVSGAKRIKIKTFEDGMTLKDYGEENRKYRETLINEYSSRSHTIFQIFLENENINVDSNTANKFSCLNLVDLAGSERISEYDSSKAESGETGFINKSLFVLANVINKLAENKNSYIPYRDSKLTRLLSQALGGNSLTAMICTVSPAAQNYYQTLSTLRFASRAKIIKNKAVLNELIDDKSALEYYKNEVRRLQKELKDLKMNTSHNSIPVPMDNNRDLPSKEMLEQVMKTNESLSHELEMLKMKYLKEKEVNDAKRVNSNSTTVTHVNSYNPNNNVVISSNVNQLSNNPNSNNITNQFTSTGSNLYQNPNNYQSSQSNPNTQSNQSNVYKGTNNNLVYNRPGYNPSNFNPSNTNSLQYEYSNIDRDKLKDTGFYPSNNINTNNVNNNSNNKQLVQQVIDKKPTQELYSKYNYNDNNANNNAQSNLNYNYGNINSQQNPILNTNSNIINTSQNNNSNNSNIYNIGDDFKNYKPTNSKLQYDYQKVSESYYIDSILKNISQSSINNTNPEIKGNKIIKNETDRIASEYKLDLSVLQNKYKDRVKDLGINVVPGSIQDSSGILKTEENMNYSNNYNSISRDSNLNNLNQQLNENYYQNHSEVVVNRVEKPHYRGSQGQISQSQMQDKPSQPYSQTQGNFNNNNLNQNNQNNKYSYNNSYNNKLSYNYQDQPLPQPQAYYSKNYNDVVEENSRKKVYNNEINNNIITNSNVNEENDDSIMRIRRKTLFNDFPMINHKHFGKEESFEKNVKLLKAAYEEKNELLEKNLEYYKADLENYFKKKIHKARNSQLENFEDHLPIINITTEHNDLLKLLREIYESKLKDLEKVIYFFNQLLELYGST